MRLHLHFYLSLKQAKALSFLIADKLREQDVDIFSKMIGLPTRDHFCRISSTTKEEAPTPYKNSLCRFQTLYDFWIVSSSRISTVSFIATCALLPSLF